MPFPIAEDTPKDGQIIRSKIAKAMLRGERECKLPPGIYKMTLGPSMGAHLKITRAKDLVIDAEGVTILCDRPQEKPLVQLINCKNVTLRGMKVDCSQLAFTQGIVKAVQSSGANMFVDIDIDDGYETDVSKFKRFRPINFFEQDRITWKKGCREIHSAVPQRIGAQRWRVSTRDSRHLMNVEVGDPVVIPAYGFAAVSARGSENISYDNVVVYQSASMAFHEHGGGGNTRMVNCKVMRRPGTSRLISTNADGFHCKNMRKGPTVENCSFVGMQDDGINIHGMVNKVLSRGEKQNIVIAPCYENTIIKGDEVEFFALATGSSLGRFIVLKSNKMNKKSSRPYLKEAIGSFGSRGLMALELDRSIALQGETIAYNLNACGAGFVIRNNNLSHNRYRGILIRGGDGLVQGNRISYTGSSGVVLISDELEGPYPRDLIIRDNVMVNNGMIPFSFTGFGIFLSSGEMGYAGDLTKPKVKNILIENNKVSGSAKDGIRIENAEGVRLYGNQVMETGARRVTEKSFANLAVINSKGVIKRDNITKTSLTSMDFIERHGETHAEWDWRIADRIWKKQQRALKQR